MDDVETAADTGAANRLSKFLLETTVVELRIRIVKNGFDKISRPTSKLVVLQKTLLNLRASGGQFKAAARKLRVRAKLEAYRKELVALPCSDVHGSWRFCFLIGYRKEFRLRKSGLFVELIARFRSMKTRKQLRPKLLISAELVPR
ncbi:hypothetical protein [Pseudophaeobacter sp.]|uniref:hypothetical protein n=1 Tax=Pseudophaeobacter sp. TaxID=1971739 RepID=UPI00329749B2